MQDKRLFQRVLFSHDAKLIVDGSQHITQILDLSLHGFLCTQPSQFSASLNQNLQLILTLDQQRSIIMDAFITHIDNGMLGMQCHHIDIDSISQLKRLIQLNLANDELLNRNLDQLAR